MKYDAGRLATPNCSHERFNALGFATKAGNGKNRYPARDPGKPLSWLPAVLLRLEIGNRNSKACSQRLELRGLVSYCPSEPCNFTILL